MELLAHFGLERLPFVREATSFDYYQAARHDRVLMFIQGRLAQGDGRVTVIGPGGSGKSIIAMRLAEIMSPELFAVCLLREAVVNLPGHVEAVLTAVYGTIDAEQIASRKARGVQPVVIVDGAHLLHAQSEAMLDELAMAGVALIRFNREGAGDIALEAWDEGTLARMLLHRLRVAGARRALFDKDSLLAIVRRAAGNPGVAAVLAQEALLCSWYAGLDTVTSAVAEALCQGDLDSEALGSAPAAIAVPAPMSAVTPQGGADSAEVKAEDDALQSSVEEDADLDTILGESQISKEPSSNIDRDFLDQSQFMETSTIADTEAVSDPTVELSAELDLSQEFAVGDAPTAESNWGDDLLAQPDVAGEVPAAVSGDLPGSTDDFDLSQLDALVSTDDLTGPAPETGDEDLVGQLSLDDELAAFESLASAPESTPAQAVRSTPPEAGADADLDDMFATLENDSEPAATPTAPAATVPSAPEPTANTDPIDDLDAMLGSWDQPAAEPSKPKPVIAPVPPKPVQPKAANIEDELDDLLAKFDS